MKLTKKIKCKHCNSVVEAKEGMCVACPCGICIICESGTIKEACVGRDYEDLSTTLLNE